MNNNEPDTISTVLPGATSPPDPNSGASRPADRAGFVVPLAVASALFMDLMDSSALATALPTLSRVFGEDPFVLKFALTAYLITVAVLVPASGWLCDRIGSKLTFMLAMMVFVAGSISCGLSNSVTELVAARVLQGVGGSMMTPVGRNIVVATSQRDYLVKALAWFTLPAIIGPLAGPPLAGAILEYGSWRWIFFINVPVGILGLIIVAVCVPSLPARKTGRFDWRGFILIGLAIVTFMLLIETSGLSGKPGWLRLLTVATAISASSLYYRHAMRRDAVVNLKLLSRDTLAASLVASWLQRLPLGGIPYLLPLLLQTGMGLTPLIAGQVMMAMAVGSLAARFVLPPILRKLGFRTAGLILAAGSAITSASPTLFHTGTPISFMIAMMVLTSLLRGLFFILAQTLAYVDIDPPEVGHASVLFTVAQQLSYGTGITLAAWLLQLSTGGGPLSAAAFQMPFLVISFLALLSVLVFVPLRSDAGDAMRGRTGPD